MNIKVYLVRQNMIVHCSRQIVMNPKTVLFVMGCISREDIPGCPHTNFNTSIQEKFVIQGVVIVSYTWDISNGKCNISGDAGVFGGGVSLDRVSLVGFEEACASDQTFEL